MVKFRLSAISAITIAIALIAPAASLAARITPAEREKINTAAALAVEHWGGQPPCGMPAVKVVDHLVRDGHSRNGFAPFEGCEVEVNYAALNFAVVCPLIVHEFGHKFGLLHVADPSNVMNTSAAHGAPECDRELARRKADLTTAYRHARKDSRRGKALRKLARTRHGASQRSTLRRASSASRRASRWQAAVTRSDDRL